MPTTNGLRDRDVMHLSANQRSSIRRSSKTDRSLAIQYGVTERVIRTVRSTGENAPRSFVR